MSARALTDACAIRRRIRVEGIVQGVGFRPFVFRLAHELRLAGFVLNDTEGVLIEVEGPPEVVEDFAARLGSEAPPLARIERMRAQATGVLEERGFAIAASVTADDATVAPVAPDTATCADCLGELFDPADRRFRYPFINCTNCGPRFTIVRGVPYDRSLTTMADFAMCPACRAEYENPLDRRFHAQPNACPVCGPRLGLVGGGAGSLGASRGSGDHALRAAVAVLRDGRILAVKGLGGFHLACLAADEEAVAALRARKHREDKPFALMAADLCAARRLVELGPDDEALLISPVRPIVVAARRPGADVAAGVAPRCHELGVMLPYTPLHHLLAADVGEPLVLTSGNVSDEPIAYRDEDALARLADIADFFLLHDRAVETRTDDSVIRAGGFGGPPLVLRRSRGFVPVALDLPLAPVRPLLACGAQLKNTFCLAAGRRAWVSQHIGDLENFETLQSFSDGVAHFERLFAVTPELVVHDLHPEYLSTKWALERDVPATLGVQHHHAHLAACLAEHGETGPAVGAIYDGTGYGTDGTIWGGELLVGDLTGFERAGSLWPVRMPGGERAVREPWRMACAWLIAALDEESAPPPPAIAETVGRRAWDAVARLAVSGLAAPMTSSMGRLFDAVAALCGVRLTVNYEGQAAIEFEAVSDPNEREHYPLPVVAVDEGHLLLDARPTVLAVVADLAHGVPVPGVAGRFHNALAAATARACAELAAARGLGTVVLSGGTFQNRRLGQSVAAELTGAGLRVLRPERLPAGDGGIAYGQAAVAAACEPGS